MAHKYGFVCLCSDITLKQFNSLTSIHISSCLGGLEVMHHTGVREVLGSIPGSGKDFYGFFFVCCCWVLTFLSKKHYLSKKARTFLHIKSLSHQSSILKCSPSDQKWSDSQVARCRVTSNAVVALCMHCAIAQRGIPRQSF